MMDDRSDITRLLVAASQGDEAASDQFVVRVYDHLKRLAHNRMLRERADHTLNTTGLVHEAYLKLIDITRVSWEDRGHFYAMASRVMKRILINHALKHKALKRGGGSPHVPLEEESDLVDISSDAAIELNEALDRLSQLYPRPAEAIAHRYFGGLTNKETAEALGVSVTTVEADLRFARARLKLDLSEVSREDESHLEEL